MHSTSHTAQHSTHIWSTELQAFITISYNTLQDRTALHCTAQPSPAQPSPAQPSPAQHSTSDCYRYVILQQLLTRLIESSCCVSASIRAYSEIASTRALSEMEVQFIESVILRSASLANSCHCSGDPIRPMENSHWDARKSSSEHACNSTPDALLLRFGLPTHTLAE